MKDIIKRLVTLSLVLILLQTTTVGAVGNEFLPLPGWLHDAVIYEVYPSAFADSDGDGMGDINGITEKLDYIRSLGCNTVWINACFCSEFRDGGYDVTDYYRVAQRYGTNDDMRRLMAEAHKRGMHILLDLVAGHTSDRHPWFQQSSSIVSNEFSDRYIWTQDSTICPDKFVCSMRSDTTRNGNYLKNYFAFQPALNYGYGIVDPAHPWEEPVDAPGPTATRRELMRVMDFWMDMGCDGFRIDMAGSLVKNDPTLTATRRLWTEVRHHFQSRYPNGVLLAEWGHPDRAASIGFMADFLFQYGIDGWRDMFCNETGVFRRETCYFESQGRGNPERFIRSLTQSLDSLGDRAFLCVPTGNHDVQRLNCGSRNTADEIKAALAFILMMPGIPCVYYGDEIGMRYRESMPDIEGSVIKAGNRAGSRTAMEWQRVAEQLSDSSSILCLVRRLLSIRQHYASAGAKATIEFLTAARYYPMAFLRSHPSERESLFVCINPTGNTVSARYDTRKDITSIIPILTNSTKKISVRVRKGHIMVAMPPFSVYIGITKQHD